MTIQLVKTNHKSLGRDISNAFFRTWYAHSNELMFLHLTHLANSGDCYNIVPCSTNVLENFPKELHCSPNDNTTFTDNYGVEHKLIAVRVPDSDNGGFFLMEMENYHYNNEDLTYAHKIIDLCERGIVTKEAIRKSLSKNVAPKTLGDQWLHRYSDAFANAVFYSQKDGSFDNTIHFNEPLLGVEVYKPYGFGSSEYEWAIVSPTEVILPLHARLDLVRCDPTFKNGIRGLNGGTRHIVKESVSLEWMSCENVNDGLVRVETNGLVESDFQSHESKFNTLNHELLSAFGLDLPISEGEKVNFQFVVPYRNEEEVVKHLSKTIYLGDMYLSKEEDGWHLAPLATQKEGDKKLQVYVDDYKELQIVFKDESMKIGEIKKILVDFYRNLRWDVDISVGQICGGGYNCASIYVDKVYRLFTEDFVTNDIIVPNKKST